MAAFFERTEEKEEEGCGRWSREKEESGREEQRRVREA